MARDRTGGSLNERHASLARRARAGLPAASRAARSPRRVKHAGSTSPGSRDPPRSSATRSASRTSSPSRITTRTSWSAGCTRRTGCSRWIPAAARRAARSPSCSARARSRATPSCGRSASAARPCESLAALSPAEPRDLEAYADGVNAWLAAHPLPSEYAALELTGQLPAVDACSTAPAVAKLLAFGLSFDTNDIANTQRLVAYQTAARPGFDGYGAVHRGRDAERAVRTRTLDPARRDLPAARDARGAALVELLRPEPRRSAGDSEAKEKLDAAGMRPRPPDTGSNVWVVSGAKSASGRPMVASDPHLSLPSPSTFYEVGVDVAQATAVPLRRHLPGHAVGRARDERAHRLGLDRQPDRRHRRLPGDRRDRGRRSRRDDRSRATRADADLPAELPGEPARQRHARRPRRGAARGERAAGRGRDRRNNGPLISVTGTSASVSSPASARRVRPTTSASSRGPATSPRRSDAQRYFDFGAQNWMYADDSGNIGY